MSFKLTLTKLESLLLTACDDLRGSMDADDIEIELDDVDNYSGKYFFVPERACWNNLKHIKENVGTALNKALEAIEDANQCVLE